MNPDLQNKIDDWRQIPYAKHLEVNLLGQVRNIKTGYVHINQFSRGYPRTCTRMNGVKKTILIHRAILSAFKPVEGWEKLDVDHIDANRGNFSLDNLRWCTRIENRMFTVESKRHSIGSNNGKSKLDEGKVLEMLNTYYYTEHRKWGNKKLIAEKYGMSTSVIRSIFNGKSWEHVFKKFIESSKNE